MSLFDDHPLTELDGKAMSAVHGGQDNQAIGTSESNLQGMLAAGNVGNVSKFCGPTNIQSDNSFNQDATNTNTATNVDEVPFIVGARLVSPLVRERMGDTSVAPTNDAFDHRRPDDHAGGQFFRGEQRGQDS